jgi:uncharacterized membrane protein
VYVYVYVEVVYVYVYVSGVWCMVYGVWYIVYIVYIVCVVCTVVYIVYSDGVVRTCACRPECTSSACWRIQREGW